MKKVVNILVIAVCCMCMATTTAQAQFLKWGIKGGVNMTKIDFEDYKDKMAGFFVGPMAEMTIPIIGLGVDAALLFSQKGIKAEGSFTINGGSYQQTAGLPPAADADLHPGSDPDFLCHQQALCKAAAGYDEGYQVHLKRRLLCAGRRIW